MRETLTYAPAELTRPQASPRLRGGDIFMAEPIVAEVNKVVPQSPVAEASAKGGHEAPLRAAWDSWKQSLPVEDRNNHATNETIETAVKMGIAPGGNQEVRKENFEKVQKEDADRLEKARGLLKKESLSPREEKAILEAHYYGVATDLKSGKQYVVLEGKDKKRTAGIGNYKREQLAAKADILVDGDLKNPLIDKEGRRILMEEKIVGAVADIPAVTDARVQNVVDELRHVIQTRTGDGNPLPLEFVRSEQNRVRNLIDTGADPTDAQNLLRVLHQWEEEAQRAEAAQRQQQQQGGRGGRGSGEFDPQVLTDAQRAREMPLDSPERAVAIQNVVAAINNAPSIEAPEFPNGLLEAASYFPETREMLISQIIFKPYEISETEPYYRMINTYIAGPRLDRMIDATLKDTVSIPDKTERKDLYTRLNSLRAAAESFHTMNSFVIQGQVSEFVKAAGALNYQEFGTMQQIPGAAEAIRLYEQKFQEMLARDTWISTEAAEQIQKEVEDEFFNMNVDGLLKSAYAGSRTVDAMQGTTGVMLQESGVAGVANQAILPNMLQEWEMRRALHIGRTYLNITFRAAEKVSWGQFPSPKIDVKDAHGHIVKVFREKRGTGQIADRFSSFYQESNARMMNYLELMINRFDIAGSRGGVMFLDMLKQKYREAMRADGRLLGKNKIKQLGGINVEEMQMASALEINGVLGSWRLSTMAFPAVKIDGGMSVLKWVEQNEHTLKKPDPKHHGELTDKEGDEYALAIKPLLDRMHIGLGGLVKDGLFDGKNKYEARVLLWKRIAEVNIPTMIDYLQNLQIDGEVNSPLSLESILRKHGDPGYWGLIKEADQVDTHGKVIKEGAWKFSTVTDEQDKDFGKEGSKEWRELKRKILYQHEKRIKMAIGEDLPENPDMEYTPAEQQIVDAITISGKAIAPHLADIVFPQTPFLNDMPIEKFDAAKAGSEFFKRRIGGDLPDYYRAQGGMIKMISNPASFSIDDAIGAIGEIVDGIGNVNGVSSGQKVANPFFETWLDFHRAGYDPYGRTSGIQQAFKRRMLPKALLEQFENPTSLAQEWVGMNARSNTEADEYAIYEKAVQGGKQSHEQLDNAKKKRKLSALLRMLSILFDIAPLIGITLALKTTEEAAEGIPVVGRGGGSGGHGGH